MNGQRQGRSRQTFIQVSLNGVDSKINPNKPQTPVEIAEDAIACIDAGASIIHNHIDHVRGTGEEAAQRYMEGWKPILAADPDILLFPTSNWDHDGIANFDHIEPLALSGALRIAFNDLGSTEMGQFEGGLLRGSRVYTNSIDAVSDRFDRHRRLGLGTSVQILGLSGLRDAMRRYHAGQLPPGCWLSFYFSPEPVSARNWPNFMVLPALPSALDLCLEILGDAHLPWSASLWGGDLVGSGFGKLVLERGGHLSVGLEPFRGERRQTNRTLVAEAAQLCRDLGCEVVDAWTCLDKVEGFPCMKGELNDEALYERV